MSKKETIRFILLLTVTTAMIAIVILLFCWICYLIPIDFPGTVGEWITSFSALAGGALTLGGVWWTIKDQENKRRKDLSIQYMPLITCDEYKVVTNNVEDDILGAISTSVYSTFKGKISNSNLKEIKIILKLTNHGRGEALVTNLKSGLAIYPSKDDNFINEIHDNPLDHGIIMMSISQSKNINLILSFDKTKPIPKKMIFAIYLTYFSHFDNNKINMNTYLSIKIDKKSFINYNKIKLDLFSTDTQYETKKNPKPWG